MTKFRASALEELGQELASKLTVYRADRTPIEQQWLKNLRQVRGKYDPEIEKMIPAGRSKVYPRDTRVKIKGFVAKLMELMFPAQDSNWELSVSPVPSISKQELQNVIDGLNQEKMAAQQAGEQVGELTSEEIEKAVQEFAEKAKDAMAEEIEDQLSDPDVDYPSICRKVVRSAATYAIGVIKSPMVRTQRERTWTPNEAGQYEAKVTERRRPYPSYVKVWDLFPDLSANSWQEMEGIFERMVMSRHDVWQLVNRSDFIEDQIKQYLRANNQGNYNVQSYEQELRKLNNTSTVANRNTRRYEIFRYLGFVPAKKLVGLGMPAGKAKEDDDVLADIWLLGDVVIKAEVASFGSKPSDQYHAFIYSDDEDDAGYLGPALPEELRDSQMSICAMSRALMDNAAAVAGPILEVNDDLLARGQNVNSIHSFQTIHREGEGNEANYPAVRDIKVDSHIDEILAVIDSHRKQLDIESIVPSWTMGQTEPLGEAFRTSSNMSQMTGGATMVTKDVVRSFDKFTASVLQSFLLWNMEFNDREDIKGDFQVRARGALSLVAKEVRGAALDQFISTLTEEDRAMFDMYGINLDRLKARDLPTERMLTREQAEEAIAQMVQAAQARANSEQGLTDAKTQKTLADAGKAQVEAESKAAMLPAMLEEIQAKIEAMLRKADTDDERNEIEAFKATLDQILKSVSASQPQAPQAPEQVPEPAGAAQ